MFLYSLLADKIKWYPILFDSPLNAIRSIAIWLTVALLIAFCVCFFIFKEKRKKVFLKISLACTVAYSCILGALYLVFSFQEDGIEKILFIPLLILLICIAGSAVALLLKKTPITSIVVVSIISLAFIATLVCMAIHFASGNASANNGIQNKDVRSVALYISATVLTVAVITVAFLVDKRKSGFDTKSITYAGICIAMSFALSYMRILRMPQGGSITPASILPIMIYAYAFGAKKGIFIGFTYGVLQGFQDPYILHPAQFLLDYPIAYTCIGLAGIFNQNKALKYPQIQIALGGIIAGLSRFIMHFISGIFAFGVYAPESANVVLYSLVYQAGYVLPDLAIAIIAGVLLFQSKTIVKTLQKLNPTEKNNSTEQTAQ